MNDPLSQLAKCNQVNRYESSGDAQKDFERLTGGTGQPAPSNYPPGTQIGDNGVTLRPPQNGKGPRIDIPGRGGKPHETLHY